MRTILQHIWHHSDPGFVFLPCRDAFYGRWVEGDAYTVDAVLEDDFENVPPWDQYFTPATYTLPLRKTEYTARIGVLYADLDHAFDRDRLSELPPSLLWETSLGSFQAVWLLDQPYSPHAVFKINRRLSLWLEADHGSWMPTKLLRVPGTVNYKRHGEEGRVHIGPNEGPTWFLKHIGSYLPDYPQPTSTDSLCPEVPTRTEHRLLLEKWWPRLPRHVKRMLTAPQVLDRSLTLARLASDMAAISIPPQEIFGILSRLPINKFWNRPETLWRSVVLSATEAGRL